MESISVCARTVKPRARNTSRRIGVARTSAGYEPLFGKLESLPASGSS
jgi:hypothetical protein